MDLIDEQGRLFGRINIVDALVIMLVLALVVAGIAVVTSPPADEGEQSTSSDQAAQERETRYTTVKLADQPPEVAALVEEGNVTVAGADARITDTYRIPTDESVSTVVRLRLQGQVQDDAFRVNNRVVRVGAQLPIASDAYKQQGTVLAVAESGDGLPTEQTQVTLSATVPVSVANAVAAGDMYRSAGETFGRVQSVDVRNTSGDRRRLEVELVVRTLRRAGGPEFAGRPVRPGATLQFVTAEYELEGTVTDVA